MADKKVIRDCYAQVRSIRRLMLQLQDDLGDLSIADKSPEASYCGELSDAISEFEKKLHTAQATLHNYSEK